MPSIRGAITCDSNSRENILNRTEELLTAIIKENQLEISDIESILFTATADLSAAYPAAAARRMGMTAAALMCAQEMHVEGSLSKCIRVQLNISRDSAKRQSDTRFVYLRSAKSLRPDISMKAPDFVGVAIDGPSGSGKSTAARAAAKELGYIYVDTGAMYRSAALYCIRLGVGCAEAEAVEPLLGEMDISLAFGPEGQRVMLNGEDVTEAIRTQEVADGSSKIASLKKTRTKLVALQKDIALHNNVVMDGRDIASHVMPWAQVKIYMDASPEERTSRRLGELARMGVEADREKVLAEINERDSRDMNREEAPLTRCADAVYMQTDGMSAEAVKDAVLELVRSALKKERF